MLTPRPKSKDNILPANYGGPAKPPVFLKDMDNTQPAGNFRKSYKGDLNMANTSRKKVIIPRYYKEDLSVAAWEREIAYKEEGNRFCNIAMQDEDIDPNEY